MLTTVVCNEWQLDKKGRTIPYIHHTPVYHNGKKYNRVYGYDFEWVYKRGLGVGAIVYISFRPPGNTAYISYLNMPAVPSIPMFCICGKLLSSVGKHLQCLEPEKKCSQRGVHVWKNDIPLSWLDACRIYPSDVWKYFRDNPNFFKPRVAER